ncbi:MAG: hypothetical protein JXX14_24850 [Deltaproteobacteria bacterium]|nr:hypothetical protein [Deltaproteobacteria bacterium]
MNIKGNSVIKYQSIPSAWVVWGAIGAIAFFHFWICTLLSSGIALDLDTVNFVYSLDVFDIRKLAPQPPGYLPYVLLLRTVRALTGLDSMNTVLFVSRFFSSATVVVVPMIVNMLLPNRHGLVVFSALLCALHPFFIFHGVDGQTHASEGFFAALFLFNVIRPVAGMEKSRTIRIGVLLAIGVAMRPSFLLVGIGPVLWFYRQQRIKWLIIALIVTVAGLFWIVPTILMSGGVGEWWLAHKAFMLDGFVNAEGIFSQTAWRVLLWLTLLVAPALPVIIHYRQSPNSLRQFLFAAAVPTVIFLLSTYVSEPGYFQGLVPIVITLNVAMIARADRNIFFGTLSVVIQIGILLLPAGGKLDFKTPSIPEIVQREVMGEVLLKQISDGLDPEQSALYITDYPGSPIQRQLPLLRANTDVLWIFSTGAGDIRSMSYSNDRLLTPIPGPVLGLSGSPATFNTHARYDIIVVDPFFTNENRQRLAAFSKCEVPTATYPSKVAYLPAHCFPGGRIRFGKYSVMFDN